MNNRKVLKRDWQIAFLRSLETNSGGLENLFALIDDAWNIHDSTDPTPAICRMISRWSENPNVTREKDGKDLQAVVSHLAKLNRLISSFDCLDVNTKYTETYIIEEEVRNG